MISHGIWNKLARVNSSKTNKFAWARRADFTSGYFFQIAWEKSCVRQIADSLV